MRPDVVADRTGEREYGYIEETGLLDYVDITYDGMPTRRISYEYNSADGTRTEMTLPLGDGSTTGTFHYYRPDSGTEAGRLQSITNPFGRETSWGYREDGAITSQTTDSILETVIDRDRTSGRLNSFTNKVPNSQTIKSAFDTFGYDPENRLTGFTASVTGFTLRQSERLFQYDSFGRLVSDSIYGNPLLTATNDQVWTHDGRGNITHFPEHDALQTTPPDTNNPTYEPWRREHNNDNQWTHYGAYTEAGVLDDTALLGLIGYDINGNPTQYQGHTLHFNADNQLVGWYTVDENDPPVLRADYRDDGLRAWKSVNEDALGHADRTYFLYDGDTLIAEMDADGNITAVMTWGPLGLVERATWTGVDDDYDGILYTFDPLGNVCQRLDADTGDVLSTDEYDAYGNRLTGHAADPYGYKGQYGYYTDTHPVYDDELEVWVETETGLIYCQQRYYDPAAGRWLTRDPIRHAGGVNLYEYCGGDPVNGADPSGLIIAGPSGQYAPQADGVGDRLKFPVFDIVGGAMVMYACVPNRDGLGWHYQNAGIRGNLQTGLFYDGDKVVLPDGKVVVDPSLVGPVNGDAVRASLAQAGALGLELMRKHVAIGGHPSLAAVAQPAKAVAASPGKYKVVFVTGAYPDRCKAANDMGAICYVEQHFNSFNGKANYTHVVLRTKDPLPESKAWAAAYTAAVSKEYGTDDKGGVPGGMGGRGDNNIKRCTMPAILCEPFFVDIDKGAAWALDTKPGGGQDRLAACLANSVRQQFPGGGLVVFSIGHKGNTANPGDMGTAVNNSKLMEADCAEAVLKKAAALLEE